MEALVEPRAHEGVAAFDFMVEERKREAAVEGFDPQAEAAQFHGEGIKVHAVDAPLDDVAPQDGLGAHLEVVVVESAGEPLVRQEFPAVFVVDEFQDGEIAPFADAVVD